MKRVLSIQDMSCFGKCSQTIALPVLSAMGLETVPLLTSLLSSHTAIEGYRFHSLTPLVRPTLVHWKALGLDFDVIYTGYLGNEQDIELAREAISMFKREGTRIVVDPVMGDHGALYPGFDEDYVQCNAALCEDADVILPNMTEAALLLHREFEENLDEEGFREVVRALSGLGHCDVVLTGASLREGCTGIYGYSAERGDFFCSQEEAVDASYPGTGDLFASVLVGAFTSGMTIEEAAEMATRYVRETIKKTALEQGRDWYSINFEETLPQLIREMERINQRHLIG